MSEIQEDLYDACRAGELKVVKNLIANGAEIDKHGCYCLRNGVKSTNLELVKYLIDVGCHVDCLQIHDAISHHYNTIFKLLVQNAIIEHDLLFEIACIHKNKYVIQYVIDNYDDINLGAFNITVEMKRWIDCCFRKKKINEHLTTV